MNCRRTSELLSLRMDRPLTLGEKLVLWSHLPLCTACQRFGRQLISLREALREGDETDQAESPDTTAPDHPALSESSRARLKALLRNQQRSS